MKLSLAELQVDSYATQVSESELTEIKGGSAILCGIAYVVGAAIVTAGANIVISLIEADNDHEECSEKTVYNIDDCGNVTSETVIHLCAE